MLGRTIQTARSEKSLLLNFEWVILKTEPNPVYPLYIKPTLKRTALALLAEESEALAWQANVALVARDII